MTIVRFAAVGLANAAVTYLTYLILLLWLPYPVSYTVSFTLGLFLAYVFNRSFVFRARGSRRTKTLFVGAYLLQYLLGLGITTALVGLVGPEMAAAGALLVTVPFSYLATRAIFARS